MSGMSDLYIDIQLDLEQGLDPVAIARRLDIPVRWVYSVADALDEEDYGYNPKSEIDPLG